MVATAVFALGHGQAHRAFQPWLKLLSGAVPLLPGAVLLVRSASLE